MKLKKYEGTDYTAERCTTCGAVNPAILAHTHTPTWAGRVS